MTHPAVALALDGRIAPSVALARLLLDGLTPDEIGAILPPSSTIAALFATHRANLVDTAEMLRRSAFDHRVDPLAPGDRVAAIAAMFDRAVAVSPDASVAAYSLGDAALLAAATREIVDWLLGGGYAGPLTDVLDLGCGTGRVAAALAPHVRSVLGIDVSAGMIAEARRRHDVPNLRFAQTKGVAIDLPRASLDLILAVDSMPYLVQAGIADAHVADARRLLRPGAALVVLNLSYRGDGEIDRADAQAWAATFDMMLVVAGDRPFVTWDGAAYVFRISAEP